MRKRKRRGGGEGHESQHLKFWSPTLFHLSGQSSSFQACPPLPNHYLSQFLKKQGLFLFLNLPADIILPHNFSNQQSADDVPLWTLSMEPCALHPVSWASQPLDQVHPLPCTPALVASSTVLSCKPKVTLTLTPFSLPMPHTSHNLIARLPQTWAVLSQ